MTKPIIDAFFFGRALALVLSEKAQDLLANTLSELGKFDAEAREEVRKFTEEVTKRYQMELEQRSPGGESTSWNNSDNPEDLQEMIDNLRAEIASLRAELKNYQNPLN